MQNFQVLCELAKHFAWVPAYAINADVLIL